jgi:hypothetical protein
MTREDGHADYVVIWFEAGEPRELAQETAEEAIMLAKGMIEAGRAGVEVRMPRSKSTIKGQAILDICDVIDSFSAKQKN